MSEMTYKSDDVNRHEAIMVKKRKKRKRAAEPAATRNSRSVARTITTMRLPNSLMQALAAAAKENQVSRSLLMEQVLEAYVKKLRPVVPLPSVFE